MTFLSSCSEYFLRYCVGMRAKANGSDPEKVRRAIAIMAGKGGSMADLALTFGDVLGVGVARKRSAVDALKDVLLLLALLLPVGRRSGGRPTSDHSLDVLLVSARHDKRSRARIGQLDVELRRVGGRTWIANDNADVLIPGWGPWAVATRLHCEWSEMTKVLATVFSACRQADVPRAVAIWLARWLAVQAVRTNRAESVLRSLRPRMVITDFDRGLDGGPFAAAARRRAIYCVTLVHGDPNEMSYAPPLADLILFWSYAQQRAFQSWLQWPAAGFVVGAFWQSDLKDGALPDDNRLLLVHTGAETVTELLARKDGAIQSMIDRGWRVRLRPHPMAKLDRRAVVVLRQKGLELSTGPLAADLHWASTVACGNSTVALDAAAAGRRVVVEAEASRHLRLASLAACTMETAEDLPSDWAVLVPPDRAEEWPFAAVGEDSLRMTAGVVMDLLQPDNKQRVSQRP